MKEMDMMQSASIDKCVTIESLEAKNKWLLQELNHRVRNILQVVLSLLNTQTFYLKDESARNAVQESQRRMLAISLIHKKLYLGDNIGRIAMRNYVHELVENLSESFGVRNQILFNQDIDETSLEVSRAASVGLILNEALSNAIKYAFPDNRMGTIEIKLSNQDGKITLIISDNGIGLPELEGDGDFGQLGMSLIRGLTTDLEGTLNISGAKGTALILTFDIVPDNV